MEKVFYKGLSLIETMVGRAEPYGITELATQLGLTKSNVHRLMQTMVLCGYAIKDPVTNRYQCTLKLWQLGARLGNRVDLRNVARPYIQALWRETQESVVLSVRHGGDAIYLDKIDCTHSSGTFARVGGRAPAYAVATGKALLSALDDDDLAQFWSEFRRFTPLTIGSLDQLKAEMAATRRRGFAINRGEWHTEVGGVAAPVFDATNAVRGAVGVSAPLYRLQPSTMSALPERVTRAAHAISRAMGHLPEG